MDFPALRAVQEELAALLDEARTEDGGHDVAKIRSITGTNAEKLAKIKQLNARFVELKAVGQAAENTGGHMSSGDGARSYERESFHLGGIKGSAPSIGQGARQWAQEAAQTLTKAAEQHGVKALTSGAVDAPTMVRTGLFAMPTNPARLLDLIVDRQQIPGNEFEFLRQTVRTDNAVAVADSATKPTSIYTVTSVQDRVRVYAHLSEPTPLRLFADHKDLSGFLESEMSRGVLDKLEADIVSGAVASENVVGILNTAGVGTTAFLTSVPITLRKARTAMESAHEAPTAWVLNPADAEGLDLLTTADGEYLVDSTAYANIFGNIPKVVSTSVPAGTALLADWSQCRLVVRQDTTIDADGSGALFETNQIKLRAEGRFGFAVQRPAAFRIVDLAP
ncbi:phage major capsid protein [Streptomyces cavernicola]|uniref:Phage major capsid protein n=1 Tax=Streptomyces cavernicola TaxID=3043613 RepID=A0ABT6S3L8_9ACTN|nr:phage major capsid protein [Streptomyces sp. B-S-A6]MDI3402489.1 phage major capsid protein [Streptomyces sp. B-S-A6]